MGCGGGGEVIDAPQARDGLTAAGSLPTPGLKSTGDATQATPPAHLSQYSSLIITVLGSDCKTTRFTDTQAVAAYAVRVLHGSDLLQRSCSLQTAAVGARSAAASPAMPRGNIFHT
jgi:hypothetical protein